MKRRDFLGTLAAGATLASLPINVLASPDPIIWNAETLAIQMEQMFTCRTGPAAAMCYFNSKTGDVMEVTKTEVQHERYPNQTVSTPIPPPEGYSGYYYETYVLAVEGGSAKDAEARLAKHFYDEFSKVPAGQLVWRVKPSFQSDDVVEFGKTYLTAEAIEDGTWKTSGPVLLEHCRQRHGLYDQFATRSISIGDEELVLPSDVELDFDTMNYRHVKKKYRLHKMRMRLVLPEGYDEENLAVASLGTGDGGRPKRI